MEYQPREISLEEYMDSLIASGINRQRIEDALNIAKTRGRIEMLYDNNPKFPHVSLIEPSMGLLVFFAEVSTAQNSAQMGPNDAYDLVVDSNSIDVVSVSQKLPQLIKAHYPLVRKLPVFLHFAGKRYNITIATRQRVKK